MVKNTKIAKEGIKRPRKGAGDGEPAATGPAQLNLYCPDGAERMLKKADRVAFLASRALTPTSERQNVSRNTVLNEALQQGLDALEGFWGGDPMAGVMAILDHVVHVHPHLAVDVKGIQNVVVDFQRAHTKEKK